MRSGAACHCERSEAIQCDDAPRLDCFTATHFAMTALSIFNSPFSIRAKRA
ncbi:MAG: hypothetical protein LBT00_04485 [Spirochaetaceae bacterium]|nr:hypothetical protein [Spirochaetaceae bacterium]